MPSRAGFAGALLVFLFLFSWIAVQSMTFFIMLSAVVFGAAAITLLSAIGKGQLPRAMDAVAVLVACFLALPVSALEVQRRYRVSVDAVLQVFAACRNMQGTVGHCPAELSALVPQYLPELPPDGWGNRLTYEFNRDGKSVRVGFSRSLANAAYRWEYDGSVWTSSRGIVSASAPAPPFFIFHY